MLVQKLPRGPGYSFEPWLPPLPFSDAASSYDPIREGAGGMKAGLEPISATAEAPTLRATDSILITNFPFLESSPPNRPTD